MRNGSAELSALVSQLQSENERLQLLLETKDSALRLLESKRAADIIRLADLDSQLTKILLDPDATHMAVNTTKSEPSCPPVCYVMGSREGISVRSLGVQAYVDMDAELRERNEQLQQRVHELEEDLQLLVEDNGGGVSAKIPSAVIQFENRVDTSDRTEASLDAVACVERMNQLQAELGEVRVAASDVTGDGHKHCSFVISGLKRAIERLKTQLHEKVFAVQKVSESQSAGDQDYFKHMYLHSVSDLSAAMSVPLGLLVDLLERDLDAGKSSLECQNLISILKADARKLLTMFAGMEHHVHSVTKRMIAGPSSELSEHEKTQTDSQPIGRLPTYEQLLGLQAATKLCKHQVLHARRAAQRVCFDLRSDSTTTTNSSPREIKPALLSLSGSSIQQNIRKRLMKLVSVAARMKFDRTHLQKTVPQAPAKDLEASSAGREKIRLSVEQLCINMIEECPSRIIKSLSDPKPDLVVSETLLCVAREPEASEPWRALSDSPPGVSMTIHAIGSENESANGTGRKSQNLNPTDHSTSTQDDFTIRPRPVLSVQSLPPAFVEAEKLPKLMSLCEKMTTLNAKLNEKLRRDEELWHKIKQCNKEICEPPRESTISSQRLLDRRILSTDSLVTREALDEPSTRPRSLRVESDCAQFIRDSEFPRTVEWFNMVVESTGEQTGDNRSRDSADSSPPLPRIPRLALASGISASRAGKHRVFATKTKVTCKVSGLAASALTPRNVDPLKKRGLVSDQCVSWRILALNPSSAEKKRLALISAYGLTPRQRGSDRLQSSLSGPHTTGTAPRGTHPPSLGNTISSTGTIMTTTGTNITATGTVTRSTIEERDVGLTLVTCGTQTKPSLRSLDLHVRHRKRMVMSDQLVCKLAAKKDAFTKAEEPFLSDPQRGPLDRPPSRAVNSDKALQVSIAASPDHRALVALRKQNESLSRQLAEATSKSEGLSKALSAKEASVKSLLTNLPPGTAESVRVLGLEGDVEFQRLVTAEYRILNKKQVDPSEQLADTGTVKRMNG